MSASDPLNYQGKRDVLLFPLAVMMSRNVLVMQIESSLYRPGERDPVAGDIQLKCLDFDCELIKRRLSPRRIACRERRNRMLAARMLNVL